MKTPAHSSLLTRPIAPNRNFNRMPWRRFLLIALAFTVASACAPSIEATCRQGCDNTNTFLGDDALVNTTFGGYPNTAIGYHALYYNTTGYGNSALGNEALLRNTVGLFNTANGSGTLYNNISGSYNTANGAGALFYNTGGLYNTAGGFEALHGNSTGSDNTATGYHALYSNTTSFYNTAFGAQALYSNTTGGSNTAVGLNALFDNTEGNRNVAVGVSALMNNTSGSGNIALGDSAGSLLGTGSNNIYIGSPGGSANESKRIRIGTVGTHSNTFIAGIFGVTVGSGVGVIIDSNGRLGTITSSARFKEEIESIDKTSEAIFALRPVTFHYKKELDHDATPHFGLVAEDVAKVSPDLVVRDEEGKPYTVRYDSVNAMLLNEFLKEHRKMEALEAKMAQQESINAEQQKVIQALTASLKEQAAQIQKVSAQLEANKRTPRQVAAGRWNGSWTADNADRTDGSTE